MHANAQGTILLTGATGFLGHYVLAELLRRTTFRVRALVRPSSGAKDRLGHLLAEIDVKLADVVADGRVELVEGTLPDGLDPAALDEVETVIHAAACTRFESDASGEPMRTNVDGTRKLLELASGRGVRHFVYVSTAYVCGNRSGSIEERFAVQPPESCNAYERSKWLGERSALAWSTPERAATIVRPSILFGDMGRGRATSLGGVYLIARATELLARSAERDSSVDRHAIPLRIPGRPGATCNLIPVDWAADRIVRIVQQPSCHGRIHHVTNPSPPTHAEIKTWLEQHFDIAGGRFSDESWPFVDGNVHETLFYSMGGTVGDYFRDGLVFESRDQGAIAGRLVDRSAFIRSLTYAQSRNWGRRKSRDEARPARIGLVDPAWYFEEFLPDVIPRSSVADVASLTTSVRFVVGDSSPQWVCRYIRGQLVEVVRGPSGNAEEFGFRVTPRAFDQIVRGELRLQRAFFDGEADIFGRVERALRFVPVVGAFIDEFPVHGDGRTTV